MEQNEKIQQIKNIIEKIEAINLNNQIRGNEAKKEENKNTNDEIINQIQELKNKINKIENTLNTIIPGSMNKKMDVKEIEVMIKNMLANKNNPALNGKKDNKQITKESIHNFIQKQKKIKFTEKKDKSFKKNGSYDQHIQGSGEEGIRFFKLKYNNTIASDNSGIIFSATTTNPNPSDDWLSIYYLFDAYRVCAMKINFIPALPNKPTPTKFAPLYIYTDQNSNITVSNIGDAIEYEGCKIKNANQQWQYYSKMEKITGVGNANGVNLDGYIDTNTPLATGTVVIFGENFNTTITTYGYIVITWYIACKNRN